MFPTKRLRFFLILAGLVLALISLVILAYAFGPGPDPLRIQATLAPALFSPPGGLP